MKRLTLCVALLLVLGCGSKAENTSEGVTDTMWCANDEMPVQFNLPAETFPVSAPDCFQMRVEDMSGGVASDGTTDPVIVRYHAAFSGGGCTLHGTDEDGWAGGLEAVIGPEGGDCSFPGTTGQAVAGGEQRWRPESGTLSFHEVDGEPAWSLRASIAVDWYVAPEGAEDYGTLSRHLTGSLNHDGLAGADAPSWPTGTWEGECPTNQCLSSRLGPGVIEYAEFQENCDAALEEIGEPPTVNYNFDEDGFNQLADGTLEGPYMRIPGSCRYVSPTGEGWLTWVDFDNATTDVTASVRKLIEPVWAACRIRYSGSLEFGTCN